MPNCEAEEACPRKSGSNQAMGKRRRDKGACLRRALRGRQAFWDGLYSAVVERGRVKEG